MVEQLHGSGSTGYDSKTYESIKYWYDTQAWLPKNGDARQPEGVRRARQAPTQDAVLKAAADAEARGWKLSAEKNDWYKKALAEKGMKIMRAVAQADGRHAARSAASCSPTGRKKAGADGQARHRRLPQEAEVAAACAPLARPALLRRRRASAPLHALLVICVLMIGQSVLREFGRAHRRGQRRGRLVLRRGVVLRDGACVQARRLRARDAAARAGDRARARRARDRVALSIGSGRGRLPRLLGQPASPTRAGRSTTSSQGLLPMPIWIPQSSFALGLDRCCWSRWSTSW